MEIAFVTNSRAPYRSLQFNEYAKNKKLSLTVYYTNRPEDNRPWNNTKNTNFDEIDLKGFKVSEKYGYINFGLLNIVKHSDMVILGGYEQPSLILLSILCKIYKKPYVILFDGISTNKLEMIKKNIVFYIKKSMIKNAEYVMANGTVGKLYISKGFDYPENKIFNQFLSVDNDLINNLYRKRAFYRDSIRKKVNISEDKKVLMFSGRLIDIKNIKSVVKAIRQIHKKDIVFLIVGGGELEDNLREYAHRLNVEIVITGFIAEQEELFKYYYAADAFILPSLVEPWGLVVNEAMASGLPVIVSNICGCSLDLVNEQNGYIINPYDVKGISRTIEKLLYTDDREKMGLTSKDIVKEWSFKNSRESFEQLLNKYQLKG